MRKVAFIFLIAIFLPLSITASMVKVTTSSKGIYRLEKNVLKVDSQGKILASSDSAIKFNNPQAITTDDNGDIFVADTGNQKIMQFYDAGDKIDYIKTLSKPANKWHPSDLFLAENNDLYVNDPINNKIWVYTGNNKYSEIKMSSNKVSVFSGSSKVVHKVHGIDVDQAGNIYIADDVDNAIKKYSSNGTLLMDFGIKGRGKVNFLYPKDIAVDPNNSIYVADTGNNRIQKLDQDGKFVTYYGADALGEGSIDSPKNLSVSSDGNLYVISNQGDIVVYSIAVKFKDVEETSKRISPNGDGSKDSYILQFGLDESAYIDADIKNATQTMLISTLIDNKKYNPGNYQVVWNGRDKEDEIVNDGDYLLDLKAVSLDGKKESFPAEFVISVDNTKPAAIKYELSNLLISPDNNGINDNLEINYQVSEDSLVLITIVTGESEEIVGQLPTIKVSKEVEYINFWPDKGETAFLPDGYYNCKLILEDEAGNKNQYYKQFYLDLTPPQFNNVILDNEYFSPNADNVKDTIIVSFEVSEAITYISAEVVDLDSNEIIKSLPVYIKDNYYKVLWGGYDENDKIIKDGQYLINIFAQDLAGNIGYANQEVMIDTIPPTLSSAANLYAFSPNGDGKYDSITYEMQMNEKGELHFNFGALLDDTVSAEADKNYNYELAQDKFESKLTDGLYNVTIYAVDRAGNVSPNSSYKVYVDTKASEIQSFSADPNPFTPNDDGVKDKTIFAYALSEPVYARLKIFREDGALFKQYENPTENFIYPTTSEVVSGQLSVGSYQWDGRGSKNELMGGLYSYYITVEDWVGNIATSEVKTITIDKSPSLVPFAFAEPDPFSPINENNNYTEIKYYLSRDNLEVSIDILGEGSKSIRNLINEQIQNKGEQTVRWYGDFMADYDGPKAVKNQYRVGDGSYEFMVYAIDPEGGNPAVVTNTVLVDNTPPSIVAKPLSVDYQQNRAVLEYNIPEKAKVSVKVYDLDGNEIETLLFNDEVYPDNYTIIYNFDENSETSHNRYIKVVAEDQAKNIAEKITETFALNPNPITISNHQVFPSTFTPNGDGHSDLTKMSYTLDGGVIEYKVTIDILGPSGVTVKRLIEKETQTPGTYSFYWDGSMDFDLETKDGEYQYLITVEDLVGTQVQAFGNILLIATKPEVNLNISPAIISPYINVAMSYSIDYPSQFITQEALVKIEVINSSNEVVFEKMFNHTAGIYGYEWNPITESFNVNSGQYYVKISGQDGLGTMAAPETLDLLVDNDKPVVKVEDISPNPFSPDGDGQNEETAIAYSLSEDADVSFHIKKQNHELVKTLVSAKRVEASGLTTFTLPTIVWDGTNISGEVISDDIYLIHVQATDLVGNTGEAFESVTIETVIVETPTQEETTPTAEVVVEIPSLEVKNIDINPLYVNKNTKVFIDFSLSQIVDSIPVIYIGNNLASYDSSEKINNSRYDYHYYYIVGDEPDGTLPISLEVEYNDSLFIYSLAPSELVADSTSPEVTVTSIDISPAPEGEVTLAFTVSEVLKSTPKVYVTQASAETILATVSDQYTAKFDIISGFDGPVLVTIEATDLANNKLVHSLSDLLVADTTLPTITNLLCETPNLRNGVYYAKHNDDVDIYFNVSEDLPLNPTVKVNDEPAEYHELIDDEYHYKYVLDKDMVDANENNEYAIISVSALDSAGNEGALETTGNFIIDIATPEVINIVDENNDDLIANPHHFATNADPGGSIPVLTTLHYKLSEDSKLILGVHKIPNDQVSYKKEDFTDDNKVTTLIDGQWKQGGVDHAIQWNGIYNQDQYAEPGKYAYIVTAQDAAGNVTEIKYGGTFWIQDNALKIVPPDQEIVNNPDPLIISPFGNSEDGSNYKRAKLYFKINIGITPSAIYPSEWIKAMDLDIDWDKYVGSMKKVGTYQVKVYDADDQLVWSSPVEEALSAKDIYVDWPGVETNGNYKLVVEVKDFRGQVANINELGDKWVAIDNTVPQITAFSASPAYFAPGSLNSSQKTTTVSYQISDNSGKAKVNIKAYQGDVQKAVILNDTEKESGSYSFTWDGSNLVDGQYALKIFLTDDAGNSAIIKSQNVVIDKIAPSADITINNGNPTYTLSSSVNIYWSATDTGSGIDKVCLSNGSAASNWSSYLNPQAWTLPGNDGSKTIYVRVMDKAGNYSDDFDTITLDLNDPYFTSGPTITSGHFNNTWSTNKNVSMSFGSSDGSGSGINHYGVIVDGIETNLNKSTTWSTQFSDGSHTAQFKIYDNAGRTKTSSATTFKIDTTAPNAPDLSVSHTPVNTWSNHNSPYISWANPGDNGGSGVDHYVGYINGVSQGNVLSPWHPTLSDGERTIYIKAVDVMGYSKDSNSKVFKIDTVKPDMVFNSVSPNPFNQLYETAELKWTITDNYSPTVKYKASICKGDWVTVRTIHTLEDGYVEIGQKTYIWDGKNDSGDYVNEGNYLFVVEPYDEASNGNVDYAVSVMAEDDKNLVKEQQGYFSPYIEWGAANVIHAYWYKEVPGDIHMFGRESNNNGMAWGVKWGPETGIDNVLEGQDIVKGNNYWHRVYVQNNEIYYQRWQYEMEGLIGTAKLTIDNMSDNDPCIIADENDNAYVIWKGVYVDYWNAYFQKIPFDFAPVKGTVTENPSGSQAFNVIDTGIYITQSLTLETPTLISPNDTADVTSIRPTFEWKHVKGNAQEYRIDLAKNDNFTILSQNFLKSANTGSVDKDDSSLFYYTYAIHEFDPGLDKDTYYWKVTAFTTNESSTSEVRSFTLAPSITLTGVTNYPNPFNPNREVTKIRYRLGADTDSVTIRIYDITGRLVKEITNCPTDGEGASVWSKYNDVDWDGRNDRGDLVLNGIYPFEILATLNGQTLSVRGKVAVLK